MKRNLAVLAIALAQGLTVHASANETLTWSNRDCYARVYSPEHMNKHPGQSVTRIVFQITRTSSSSLATASAGVRIRTANWTTPILTCHDKTSRRDNYRCEAPDKIGAVEISFDHDYLYVLNKGIFVGTERNGYDYWFEATPENTLFALEEVPCL
jgi:hypothetical protein